MYSDLEQRINQFALLQFPLTLLILIWSLIAKLCESAQSRKGGRKVLDSFSQAVEESVLIISGFGL